MIDMRLKFKKPPEEYTDRTCIIVIETQAFAVGLIVDQVSEVLTIDDANIVSSQDVWAGTGNRYLSGIGKVDGHIKLLLDCEAIFSGQEEKELSKIMKEGKISA